MGKVEYKGKAIGNAENQEAHGQGTGCSSRVMLVLSGR